MWNNATFAASENKAVLMAASLAFMVPFATHTETPLIHFDSTSVCRMNPIEFDINKIATFEGSKQVELFISDELAENLDKLQGIAALPDNWNDNGAEAFSKVLIEKIKDILLGLHRQPEVFPTACDAIQLEYDGLNNSYMEIVVSESKWASVFQIDKDGKQRNLEVSADAVSINGLVDQFYG